MSAEVMPGAGPAPRRARHLIPAEFPRRGEVIAACAVLVLLGHLLFAQLTFILAAVFVSVSKVSRWRLWWLTVPAAAGLGWTLAIGPRAAAAGFTAGPAAILGYLSGGGHPFTHLLHPHGAFVGAGSWLWRQFPLALIAAAAEAALVGWLDWMHTDEWAVPPRRPGAIAAARGAVAGRAIRAGAMLTRDGFVLGVAPGNGARVLLGWPEVEGGVLVTGAVAQEITVTSLQVVHAALRRRKPVIAVDLSGDASVAGAVAAACQATGTPLQVFGTAEGRYEPFSHASPDRRLTMTLALLRGSAPGVRAYLRAVFELIDEIPADSRTPVLDDVRHLLNPLALQTRLGLVAPASPRRDQLAQLVRAAARTAQAAPEALLAVARQLEAVRASPAGRWLSPAPDGIDLARVVRQRSAVLFSVDALDVARLVCADIAALGEDLRGLGVDGDGLVWLHGWDTLPTRALTGLLSGGMAAGLPVLVTTTSPAAAADLADHVNAVLVHRLANADTAARLAAHTGTRLVPASLGAEQTAAASLPAWPLVPAMAAGASHGGQRSRPGIRGGCPAGHGRAGSASGGASARAALARSRAVRARGGGAAVPARRTRAGGARPAAAGSRTVTPPALPRPLPGQLYLGWQYATLHPDPGPPPRRPVPPGARATLRRLARGAAAGREPDQQAAEDRLRCRRGRGHRLRQSASRAAWCPRSSRRP